MINKVRWGRPHATLRAWRKLRARAASLAYGRRKRQALDGAVPHDSHVLPAQHDHGQHGHVQPEAVKPGEARPPRKQTSPLHAAPNTALSPGTAPAAQAIFTELSLLPSMQHPPRGRRKEGKAGKSGKSGKPRSRLWRSIKWLFWLTLLTLLVLGGLWSWHEMRHAEYQAEFFHRLAAKAQFRLADGPSKAIRFPHESPYDERLGYANLPEFLQRLQNKDYKIVQQARMSPQMLDLVDQGLFAPYAEKTQVGLVINDCRNDALFRARFPERIFPKFEAVPPLLVNSLLFIENRELLDPRYPKRNPAVEWDRLSKAVFDQVINGLRGEHKSGGGSTLATQIEKYRHSPDGRTIGFKEKARQMLSASFRAYQDSEETTLARRRIVLDYLNTVPLSAKPGFGEVNGMGDGLWVWYGREFSSGNQLLLPMASGAPLPGVNRRSAQGMIKGADASATGDAAAGTDASGISPDAALAYKQALSLMIAQRRPSWYLGDPDNDLETLTHTHLQLLAKAGVISAALRDAALKVRLQPLPGLVRTAQANSFVTRKASNAVRTALAGMLGDPRLYNLDRLDLSVQSTLDARAQEIVGKALRDLREFDTAKAAGLLGKQMLGNGDPAQVVYSMTLLERGEQGNYLRIQTDNLDQPLDINDGAKLDLGSTAKLRTLITYLDIIANLYQRYGKLDEAALKQVELDPKDVLSRWALDYFLHTGKPAPAAGLRPMLEAALDRKYSGNPSEGFFTGGGMHTFGNFNKDDNGRILMVREGLRNSTNLVFVRLLRDVVHYYMFQTPGSSASLLQNADDPRRAHYLSRFADREGKVFMNRFYPKYRGKTWEETQAILLQNIRPTPQRLAAIHRSIYPDASIAQFDAFVRANLPEQYDVSVEKWAQFYVQFSPGQMSLADRGYLAHIHPLELWMVGYLRTHPKATQSQMLADSAKERQEVYAWLFQTHRKHAQDKRILGLLEVEGFLEIHRQWKKMGYPFDSLVPSYASALGASADRPAALAEMMGILLNHGVRKPILRIQDLHFAAQTPYETRLQRKEVAGEVVLPPEVAEAVIDAARQVVASGTAKRVDGAFVRADGTILPVGGKTGTGDQRYDVYGPGGRLLESRFVNRSATFVFYIGDRYYGSITAYVRGPQSENYDFTSALPVQLLKTLAPSLMQLIDPASGAACRAR